MTDPTQNSQQHASPTPPDLEIPEISTMTTRFETKTPTLEIPVQEILDIEISDIKVPKITDSVPPVPDSETSPTQPGLCLQELSELDAQGLAGGFRTMRFDFFFSQDTAIDTFAANRTQLSNAPAGLSASSESVTGYSLRRSTVFAGSLFLGGGSGVRGGGGGNPMAMLSSLFRRLGFGG